MRTPYRRPIFGVFGDRFERLAMDLKPKRKGPYCLSNVAVVNLRTLFLRRSNKRRVWGARVIYTDPSARVVGALLRANIRNRPSENKRRKGRP